MSEPILTKRQREKVMLEIIEMIGPMTDDNDGSPRTIPVAPNAPASGKDFVTPKPPDKVTPETWIIPDDEKS